MRGPSGTGALLAKLDRYARCFQGRGPEIQGTWRETAFDDGYVPRLLFLVLVAQGATVKAIQELAGHRDITTTQRYMHLSPAHKDAAIRLLDGRPVGEEEAASKLGDGFETTPRGGTKPSEVE